MASKSSHHKESNFFRFQSFNERIAQIHIDVRKVRQPVSDPQDVDTLFGEGVIKWADLNCTQDYVNFTDEVFGLSRSFTLLVHNQSAIIDILERHLLKKDSLALPALFDLIVLAARDLQGDFYPHFPRLFSTIVTVLKRHHHDPDALEQGFTCLAFLFKVLWRLMVKDIQTVYRLFSPLLEDQEKEYIRAFAAESFSFLMRKVNDHRALFIFIFETLIENPHQSTGVGRLLFEMMKGVQKGFHSNTSKILPLVLSYLGPHTVTDTPVPELPWEQISQSLQSMCHAMISHTTSEHSAVVIIPIIDHLEELSNLCKSGGGKKPPDLAYHVQQTVKLLSLWLKRRKSVLFTPSTWLCQVLAKLLKTGPLDVACNDELLYYITNLLLTHANNMKPHDRHSLISQVYNGSFAIQDVLDFTERLFPASVFENDVLGLLLSYSEGQISGPNSDQVLLTLTKLVTEKSPTPKDGLALSEWKPCILNLGKFKKHTRRSFSRHQLVGPLLACLEECCQQNEPDTASLTMVWSVAMLAPHIRPASPDLNSKMRNLLDYLRAKVHLGSDHLYVYCAVAGALLLMEEADEFFDILPLSSLLTLIRDHKTSGHVLWLADLYFTFANTSPGQKELLTPDTARDVFMPLQPHLSSPHSQVRLCCVHLMTQFDYQFPEPFDQMVDQPDSSLSVFDICLKAELVQVTLHDYREKLMHMRKLRYDVIASHVPEGDGYQQVALRYLIGTLYINLTLLWKPIMEIIQTHGEGLNRNVFWEIYADHLDKAAELSESLLMSDTEEPCEVETTPLNKCFLEHKTQQEGHTDRPDHLNFRNLLWKAMQLFPAQCEPKSRLLVPLVFQFLEREYYQVYVNQAPSQDISVHTKMLEDADETVDLNESQSNEKQSEGLKSSNEELGNGDVVDGEEMDVDVHEENQETETKTSSIQNKTGSVNASKKRRKGLNKTLVIFLKLFEKFKNPRALYQEAKLRNLYDTLLNHKDAEIQKAAFGCIMTYNYVYLQPYRENFERLLDDKTFKNEIVLFSISEDSGCVQEDHRPGLLPVLMRILYGKMHGKTGKDSAGKGQSSFRRSIVLRFLAGCQQDEVKVFVDLLLQMFSSFLSENYSEFAATWEAGQNVRADCVMPVGRQQGLLNTVQLMVDKLKPLMMPYIPQIMQVLLYVTASSNNLLDRRQELANWPIPRLRNLRTLGLQCVIKVFSKFADYEFSDADLEAVFESAVWPQLGRLDKEGTYHPTPLLRLFYTWAQNIRYLPLLEKAQTKQPEMTPLVPVFSLLVMPTVAPSVVDCILNIVEELLDHSEDEEHTEAERNLSQKLIRPHVATVINYISGIVEKLVNAKSNKKALPTRELNLLSRISVYVDTAEESFTLVRLLLSLLAESSTVSQDLSAQTLSTATTLLKQVDNLHEFISTVAKLFWSMKGKAARSSLTELLKVIGTKDSVVGQYSDVIIKLNAWDRRSVEEPDYNVRLDAFTEVTRTLNDHEAEVDGSLLCMLVHNCCHFLSHVDDMSIRDCSGLCLSTIIDRLSQMTFNKDLFVAVISAGLLPHIKSELKHKSEVCRHEYISLLAQLVNKFPLHPVFAELHKLTNKEDVEVDFFENIKHVQIHRRARGLRRLVKQVQSHSLKTEVIMSYLLPLTSVFLFDEAYVKHNNLQDAAVEAIGGLCSALPWQPYSRLLQTYINQLTRNVQRHKLMVRVVTSILDAFHFDLSTSEDITADKSKDTPEESVEMGENEDIEEVTMTPEQSEEVTRSDPMKEEVMRSVSQNGEVEMEVDSSNVEPSVKTKCSQKLASHIHRQILRNFLPQLHKTLTQKAKSDDEHKKAIGSKYAEDEEILRVPLALAMVRLLQALPRATLNSTLPSVLLKVCQFLRSRAQDIRQTARETLIKIACSLGPKYFSYILKELQLCLTRGYQLHVLSFTIHALLKSIQSAVKPGDLDTSVDNLVKIFNEELFGKVSEEKSVEGITSKLMEAKSTKSNESYELVALFVSRLSLPKLLVPIKELLSTTHRHQQVRRSQEVLRRVSHGLLANKELGMSTLMVFTYGLTTEALPMLDLRKSKEKKEDKKAQKDTKSHLLEQPVDTYKVEQEPKRGGKKSSSAASTNMHVLIEFGLELLYLLLKREHVTANNPEHAQMLDPYVDVLIQCLSSRHVKIIILSVRCLAWVIKMPLPSVEKGVHKLTDQLFVLLNNYASHGAARGDNLDMVIAAFKTVTVLVRDVHSHKINGKQLRVLLTYVEEDLHHHNRQATAFSLLKAILSRKLKVPELEEVIEKVQQLSITADSTHVRLQCRQVVLQYILDYPLGKQLVRHLEFYLSQLEYEYESGRESSLEMMATIFSTFPQHLVVQYAGLFFLPMVARIVNDDSMKCRKLVALAVKSLLVKLDTNKRDELLSLAVLWFKNDKISLKKLAAILVGLFVEVESMKFERHLQSILPDIRHALSWGISNESEDMVAEEDHMLFHLLNTVIKIVWECGVLQNEQLTENMTDLWVCIEPCLLHAHVWVRLAASQLYGLLFASVTAQDLRDGSKHALYLSQPSPISKIRQLAESFCTQLQTPNLHPDLADQVIKNLIFTARVTWNLTEGSLDLSIDPEGQRSINLPWLIRKLCREAKHEAAQNQKATLKRSCVYKWMAAVSQEVGSGHLVGLLPLLLPPLCRTVTDNTPTADEELKVLANQVLDMMKSMVGVETFSQIYTQVQQLANRKKEDRKAKRSVEAVVDPEAGARRRIKKQLNKQRAKKRKLEEFRPTKKLKKKKINSD